MKTTHNLKTTWHLLSDQAILMQLSGAQTLRKQQYCWAIAEQAQQLNGVKEVTIGANNIVFFAADNCALDALMTQLQTLCADVTPLQHRGKVHHIEVIYGGEFGPDLEEVAHFHQITAAEVIALHTARPYTVHFLGFQPGFPYLGGLDQRLHTPRRATPRLSVPAGSVGIGGSQTGIYPFASPGGWQLIGRSTVKLFDPAKQPPTLLLPGDIIKFHAAAPEKAAADNSSVNKYHVGNLKP